MLDETIERLEIRGEEDLGAIHGAREEVRRLVADTRRLAYALRPSVLDDAGLVAGLRWCVEAYLEPAGVRSELKAAEREARFPEPLEVALFRVGREAVSNIVRHANASHVWITLERDRGYVTLAVADDGVGFDADQIVGREGRVPATGLGRVGMKERVELLGGRLEVVSRPGSGTTITATVPTGEWGERR